MKGLGYPHDDELHQKRLLAFLSNPHSYPGHLKRIQMLQTHISNVVLTARHAYKVKKPVNFGFLDFSTLEKRRHFCEREVALNRRLSSDLYLGVVPISINKGRLSFGLRGEIVEYALKMRRLPDRYFMLRRLEHGKISSRDVDLIVAALKPFYEAQQPTQEISEWGRVEKLKVSTNENFLQSQDFVGATLTRPAVDTIRLFTEAFYRRHASLFVARVRERRIRDCHGDLHLEHIHLGPAGLKIYDCIEFNDRFRYIDVANDVAFLAMDFDFHGRPDLARHLTESLAYALKDPGMPQLLDFYKCYRAYVRGKVESFHSVSDGVPESEQTDSRTLAERYFQLALRYAVCGSSPMVFIVMGRVGSGKSTLAQSLRRELGWEVVSSDRVRKELAGVPLYERGNAAERNRLYAKSMTDKTYAALAHLAAEQIHRHRGVILDATFGSRRRRDVLRKTFERAGAGYCFIETRAAAAILKQRLTDRERKADEMSDARLEDFPLIDRGYQPPDELRSPHFLAVKTARTSEAVLVATLKNLARRHACSAPE